MGYWAKDGSYVYDNDDITVRETQGQAYDRQSNIVIDSKPLFTKEEQEKRDEAYARRVEERAKWFEGNKKYREQERLREEKEKDKKLRKKAFEAAKDRYSFLSPTKKLWMKLSGKDIKNYSIYTDIETLDSLYKR